MLYKFNISMPEKKKRLNKNKMFYILSHVCIVIVLIEKEKFNIGKIIM